MCECCETRNLFSGYILPNGGHLDIILDSDCDDKPCFDVQLYVDGEFLIDESIPIKFCPECGRKL